MKGFYRQKFKKNWDSNFFSKLKSYNILKEICPKKKFPNTKIGALASFDYLKHIVHTLKVF